MDGFVWWGDEKSWFSEIFSSFAYTAHKPYTGNLCTHTHTNKFVLYEFRMDDISDVVINLTTDLKTNDQKKKKKKKKSPFNTHSSVRTNTRVGKRKNVDILLRVVFCCCCCYSSSTFSNGGKYYNHIQLRESERSNNTYIRLTQRVHHIEYLFVEIIYTFIHAIKICTNQVVEDTERSWNNKK